MKTSMLLVPLLFASGCYPSIRPELLRMAENPTPSAEAPTETVQPYEAQGPELPSVAQIKDCQSDIVIHNVLTATLISLTSVSLVAGVTAAWSNNNHNADLTSALIYVGEGSGVAGLATAIAWAFQAKDYGDDGCSPLTGTLPYSVRKASRGSAR